MQVSAINMTSYSTKNNTARRINNPINNEITTQHSTTVDKFAKNNSVNFTGYSDIVINTVNKSFKNESEIEKGFKTLLTGLREETSIIKTEKLKLITDLYEEKGFRGLLHELWMAKPRQDVDNLVRESINNTIYLAGRKEQPALTISSLGRHGFWNMLRDNPKAPRDVELGFIAPENNSFIGFYLDKRGGCGLRQWNSSKTIHSEFYAETGTPKVIATSYGSGRPETQYFNKDGSPNYLKNWLFGNPPEPIY